jgi:hypothetical protein
MWSSHSCCDEYFPPVYLLDKLHKVYLLVDSHAKRTAMTGIDVNLSIKGRLGNCKCNSQGLSKCLLERK